MPFRWDCTHSQCNAKQSTFDKVGHAIPSPNDGTAYVVAKCGVCHRPSMFEFESQPGVPNLGHLLDSVSDPFDEVAKRFWQQHKIGQLRVKRVFPAPPDIAAPTSVPPGVREPFIEGLKAQGANLLPSAVYNMRKTLERAVRDIDPSGSGKLKARIVALATAGKIPQTLVDLAHTVRAEGNVEVHEDETWTPEQVAELIDFARLLLTYLYDLPVRIAAITAKRGTTPEKR